MPEPQRSNGKRDIDALLADQRLVDQALAAGVREALLRHKKLGQSIVVWRDGQIVELQAHEIPDFDESTD